VKPSSPWQATMGTLKWVGDNNRAQACGNPAVPNDPNHVVAENVLHELDAPGEWYLNAPSGTLYYYPPADTDLSIATMQTAEQDELIHIEGTSSVRPVPDLTFAGFTFTANAPHPVRPRLRAAAAWRLDGCAHRCVLHQERQGHHRHELGFRPTRRQRRVHGRLQQRQHRLSAPVPSAILGARGLGNVYRSSCTELSAQLDTLE
jgi:hypothetical protein